MPDPTAAPESRLIDLVPNFKAPKNSPSAVVANNNLNIWLGGLRFGALPKCQRTSIVKKSKVTDKGSSCDTRLARDGDSGGCGD